MNAAKIKWNKKWKAWRGGATMFRSLLNEDVY